MPLAGPELRIGKRRFEHSVGVALHRTAYVIEVQVREQHIRNVSPRKSARSERPIE